MGSTNTNQGRYVLITGATSGFGYEFAKIRNDDKLAELSSDFTQTYMVDAVTISKETAELYRA